MYHLEMASIWLIFGHIEGKKSGTAKLLKLGDHEKHVGTGRVTETLHGVSGPSDVEVYETALFCCDQNN